MADITSSLFPEVGSLFNQQYLGAQQAGREGVAAGMGTGLQAARSQAMGLASESGYRLGSGIGRALGGTTPEEQQAAKVKAIADEITASGGNVQSEKGLTLMAQRLNASGDYAIANKVMAAAQILRKQEAEVAAKQAETSFKQSQTAKQQAETTKITTGLTNEVTAKKTAKAALEAQGVDPTQIEGILNNPKALESYLKQVDERTQTVEVDGRVKLINKADGKVIADLGSASDKKTTTNVNVAIKDPTAVAGFIKDVQATVKPYTEAIDRSDETLALLDTAFKGNNPQAFGQALAGLSGIIQGGKISNQDIQRAGGNPAIFETIKDYISGKLTGLPTKETGQNMYVTVGILKRVAEQKRKGVIEDQRRVAKSIGVPQDTIDSLFQEPSAGNKEAMGKTKKTASGVSYTVED